MSSYSCQLFRLVWSLLVLLSCCSTAQVAFPTTVEVDLIFPRNDTYAPTALMPIVFAIQNSQLAAPLDLNFQYDIFQLGAPDGPSVSGILDLRWAKFSSSDPFFAFRSTQKLNATESEWSLVWTLSSGNCSGTEPQGLALASTTKSRTSSSPRKPARSSRISLPLRPTIYALIQRATPSMSREL